MSIATSALSVSVPPWLKTIAKVTLVLAIFQVGSTVYKAGKDALSLNK